MKMGKGLTVVEKLRGRNGRVLEVATSSRQKAWREELKTPNSGRQCHRREKVWVDEGMEGSVQLRLLESNNKRMCGICVTSVGMS